jgi:uncharacterized protein (TIGR02246 family)
MQMRSLVLGLVLIPLFTACGQQSGSTKTTDTSADAATVRATVEKFVAAWNKADSAAYSSMIAEDAVLMGQDEPLLQGRDAVAARMAKDYDVTKAQQTTTVDEVIVMGDHAYARGTWNMTPTAAAGADTKPTSGKWSVLYQRGADGTWLASRWMWNQDGTLTPAGG